MAKNQCYNKYVNHFNHLIKPYSMAKINQCICGK